MLFSSQRIGIRYCLSLSGKAIDAKQNNSLEGNCQACGESISRQRPSQLFQHSSRQCMNIVLSEITERLSTLFRSGQKISLPLDIKSSEAIEQVIVNCSPLISTNVRPLLKLALEDNQVIYLTIKLEDSQLSSEQLSNLKQQNYSVIEVDLSDLTIPSSNFTSYLEKYVLNEAFHQRCFWLSFNPLDSLARNIASLEHASIERNRKEALNELSIVEKQIDGAKQALETINSSARITEEKLEQSQELLRKIDINQSIDYLLNIESDLKNNIEILRIEKSKFLQSNTEAKLTQQIRILRQTYHKGKTYVDAQEATRQKLQCDIDKKLNEISFIEEDIKQAKWMQVILTKFGFKFSEFQKEIEQIELIFNSQDLYERKYSQAKSNYESVEDDLRKKEEELNKLKEAIEFYKKEKFRLSRENNILKKEQVAKEPQ